MQISILLIEQIFELFLMILMGFIIVKAGIVKEKDSKVLSKIVLNINMISIAIGAVLFFTRIRLPELITDTLSSVGNMIGPASMIVTGMLFAGMNFKEIFANKRVYFISFLRMIIITLIALLLIKVSHTSRKTSRSLVP